MSRNIVKRLRILLEQNPGASLRLVFVPSHQRWPLQRKAHDLARASASPWGVNKPYHSKRLKYEHLESELEWIRSFNDFSTSSSSFLTSTRFKKRLQPSEKSGGPWISWAGTDNSLYARLCRALCGHAPIGEYRRRFNLQGATSCPCGHEHKTRAHIIDTCPWY